MAIIRILPGKVLIECKETTEAYMVQVGLPGLKKEEVEVEIVEDRVLLISREKILAEEEEIGVEPVRNGKFSRKFFLPENAKVGEGQNSVENGVLTVIVPMEEIRSTPDSEEIEISRWVQQKKKGKIHDRVTIGSVGLKDPPEGYVLKLELPLMKKEEVKMLVEIGDGGENWVVVEVEGEGNGGRREFKLPKDANKNRVEASMENGILTVNVAKKKENKLKTFAREAGRILCCVAPAVTAIIGCFNQSIN